MIVLGIETTCDETAASVVREGKEILSNVISSQIELHQAFGGVVPELASRQHAHVILPIIDQALSEANMTINDIDLISVAKGPGLIGPLMIGINAAKTLSWSTGIPFIGVNHIEAHLYAALMSHQHEVPFPSLGVVLSGGHTSLVLMNGVGNYHVIGQTIDDAVGEAFDKVAKILGLPYPGGPEIERLAKMGDPSRYSFKSGRVKNRHYDFSFSGLKTAVLYAAKGAQSKYDSKLLIQEEDKPHIAASFQQAALTDIVKKSVKAAHDYHCSSVVLGGGVTCNQRLREMFVENEPKIRYYWPSKGLSLDNAAMIAGLGYEKYRMTQKGDPLDLEASTSLKF
ncbi:MAG: tRNA N6-adenosine threonylcarbamoyltransferase [Chlamydiae bacterium]|nr:tRNA N6-adenosine threonylcarbamoyltransferase [Chlamydiota bacterium]